MSNSVLVAQHHRHRLRLRRGKPDRPNRSNRSNGPLRPYQSCSSARGVRDLIHHLTSVASEIMNALKHTMTVSVISVRASSMMYPSEKEPSMPRIIPMTGPTATNQTTRHNCKGRENKQGADEERRSERWQRKGEAGMTRGSVYFHPYASSSPHRLRMTPCSTISPASISTARRMK